MGSKYIILQEEIEKGSIDVDWKNNITITFIDQSETTQVFKMERKGFWKQRLNSQILKERLWLFDSSKQLEKLANDFAIESSPRYSDLKYFDELVIYCGFVVRLIQQYAIAGYVVFLPFFLNGYEYKFN